MDRIESEFVKPTGLKELFEKNSGDIFKSNNYYVNIIFGLEQLVHIRKYVSRTINCGFYEKNDGKRQECCRNILVDKKM